MGGTTQTITWHSVGAVGAVVVDYSVDDGDTWSQVDPPNVGNTGSYNWLVPTVDSDECLVRVANAGNLSVYDTSNEVFTIYECTLDGDLDSDCEITMADFAIMAAEWLECARPTCPL
jgi:hypothetical protein